MFEYENLTVSKLSLVLKTGCYSQREFMFTFQKYFFLELKRILCMCVLQKEKKLSRAALPSSASLTLTPPSCVSASCYAAILLPLRCRFAPSCAHIFLGKFFFHVTVCVLEIIFFATSTKYPYKEVFSARIFLNFISVTYRSGVRVSSRWFFLRGQSAVANEISKSGFPHFISECSSQ